MSCSITRWAAAGVLALALAGCGGGGDGGPGAPVPPPPPSNTAVGQALAAAAANPANDTSVNSSSAFRVLQAAGVPAVVVGGGAARVNFAVFTDLGVKAGLTNANVRVAIAKFVPGSNGEIDQWQSYIFRTETTTGSNAVGPGGTPVLASAKQATTDPNTAASLVYNSDGYYTYTFTTDITNPAQTDGVTFEPNRTHRIAIQLSYRNAAGETVLVNPYIDVTFDANGRSVLVTDPNQTRVMADVSSCNGCHEKLALHGGGRVDVQYCVMCHNPRTTDANSGNVLTMATMTHKLHAGRLLKAKLDAGQGGEDYVIWGFQASKNDYAEVGFPQDLRNCTVCHSAANPKTPQGDNWKSRASKEACLTCHANGAGSTFVTTHRDYALAIVGAGAQPKDIPNANCADCHQPGRAVSPERVHWNQNEENAARYKVVIDSATFDAAGRKVTVKYAVVDPINANTPYNLVTSDCTGSGATLACGSTTKFGNLRFYLAYPNLVGQPAAVTEFTAYNNGGSGANAYLYKGANDGSNRYTIDIPLPADSATAVAQGTARVVGVGQVKEPKLEAKSAADPRPPAPPVGNPPQVPLVNVVVQHAFTDVVLSGAANPRRQVVSNEKCNVCHGALGTTSGSNTLAEAFHSGARNTVEACALCHDQNRMSSTVMTNGLALQENYGFKRMIHGIHGNSKRTTPFTHGNPVRGVFSKAGELQAPGGVFLNNYTIRNFAPIVVPAGTAVAAGATFQTIEDLIATAASNAGYTGERQTIENYAAEVRYPALGLNCNACHVNDSWKRDAGPVGAVVAKPLAGGTADPNPLNWQVISPKAASCTACHDSPRAIDHVATAGGSAFGTLTQGQLFFAPRETCDDCHAVGTLLGVDRVHGQK